MANLIASISIAAWYFYTKKILYIKHPWLAFALQNPTSPGFFLPTKILQKTMGIVALDVQHFLRTCKDYLPPPHPEPERSIDKSGGKYINRLKNRQRVKPWVFKQELTCIIKVLTTLSNQAKSFRRFQIWTSKPLLQLHSTPTIWQFFYQWRLHDPNPHLAQAPPPPFGDANPN